MEESGIIYPLNGDDIIPVRAKEIICFQKHYICHEHRIVGHLVWVAVKLENGTMLRSNRYDPSEASNLLRLLLKRNNFVIVKREDLFLAQDHIIKLSGVRFSAITKIGKNLDQVDYVDGNGEPSYFTGKVVESTVVNYKKWKDLQEKKNGRIRDNLSPRRI